MRIDDFSYALGAADCFCEMVRAGVKRLALSHPCDSREERDRFLPEFQLLARKYGVKLYVENDPLLTDLFPLSMNRGKYNVLFYREDSVLTEYLRLKEEKQKWQGAGSYTPEKRWELAQAYGLLLSYPQEGIRRLVDQNQEKEE